MKEFSNPFSSRIFSNHWMRHFKNDYPELFLEFIEGVTFYKHPRFPLYVNVGRNQTKGVSYELIDSNPKNFKEKVFVIYDIPSYFEVNTNLYNKNIKIAKIRQYPGFLIKLDSFSNLHSYMASSFGKKSRYKFNAYRKKLESCFDISYNMYFGEISRETYDTLFEKFRLLLEKRFDEKGEYNNNLDPKEWNFFYDVSYPMILEKKASLFVCFERSNPIGIMLNYMSEDTLYQAITVFDVDFSKFSVGSVNIMKLIEWCLGNEIDVLDFSKGYYDYKKRWGNLSYDFEYHLLYDSKSLRASIIALCLKLMLTIKQYLRDKQFNELLHRITFLLKNRKNKTTQPKGYTILNMGDSVFNYSLSVLDIDDLNNKYLKLILFEFLHSTVTKLRDVKVYRVKDKPRLYYFESDKMKQMIQLK